MAFFIPIFEPNIKKMAISTNDIKIRYVIDTSELSKAQQGFDKLSKEEQQAVSELRKLNSELDKTSSNASKAGNNVASAMKKGTSGTDGFMSNLKGIGPAIVGAFSVAAVTGFAKSVFEVTAEFEKMEAVLKNTLGSQSAAMSAMKDIEAFAAKTPFSVQELTQSYVKLVATGFKPTMDEMKKMGDVASSMSLGFEQYTEAIIDAQQGNFERLKAFTIDASSAGNKVIFTYKGIRTEVDKNNESIRNYLVSLGEYNGVAGSAAVISETMGGKVNNLGDSWDRFMKGIGSTLGSALAGALDATATFLEKFDNMLNMAGKRREKLTVDTYNKEKEAIKNLTDEQLVERNKVYESIAKSSMQTFGMVSKTMATGLEAVQLGMIQGQTGFDFEGQKKQTLSVYTNLRDQAKAKSDAIKTEQKEREDAKKKGEADQSAANAKSKDDAKKAAEEARKINMARYQDELKAAQLRSEIEKLQAELDGKGKEEQLMLEAAYQEDLLNIKQKYLYKGIDITQADIDKQKLVFRNAQKDANNEAKKNYQEQLDEQKKSEEEKLDQRNKYNEELLKKEKEFDDLMAKLNESMLQAEVDAREKAEKEKQDRIEATFQLANTLLSGFSDAYQTSINNEIAAMNKRYDAEIEMAGGNEQKIQEINNRRAEQEKELKIKAFRAEQLAATARVVFETAALIAKWSSNPITFGLAALTLANQAAQIGFIYAQPVPEFAEGTKGQPFKGGRAMVGEKGVEKVVTASGKVYFTPPTATLVDLPSGSQVIPNHALSKQELFYASRYSGGSQASSPITGKLDELGSILRSLPITQLNMDERGFEKYIRTEKRATKILNNRFRS